MANKRQIKGKATEMKGEAREAIGAAMGDDRQVAKGRAEQTEGKAQGLVGDAIDTARGLADKSVRTMRAATDIAKDAIRRKN